MQNLINKKFGRLKVISYQGKSMWKCQCSCGNYKNIRGSSLKSGATQSCGCLQKEKSIKNLIGKKFGKLIVIKDSGKRYNKNVIWLCKCDCGNYYEVTSKHLQDGHVKSCGCEKRSNGVIEIEQLLIKNNIKYQKEKTFETCRFSDTHALAKFDFYIDNRYLIEFDGAQHFKSVDFYGGQEGFKKRLQHDCFKNQWCKQNNIPLIRISYTKVGAITFQDIII